MNQLPFSFTLADITAGKVDNHFDMITTAIQNRRRVLQFKTINEIKVDDFIWFNDRTKPRYMVGLKAKVTKINNSTITVDLVEGSCGRFQSGKGIRVPISLVTTTPPADYTD